MKAEWTQYDPHELGHRWLETDCGYRGHCHISIVDLKTWRWHACGPKGAVLGEAPSLELAQAAAEAALDAMIAELAAARGYKLTKVEE